MENKDLIVKPQLEIIRFAPNDILNKSLHNNEGWLANPDDFQ